MTRQRINYLIDALNNNCITEEERAELLKYYNSYQLDAQWDTKRMGDFEQTKSRILARIMQDENRNARIRSIRSWMGWAAASILLFVLSWFGYSQFLVKDSITILSENTAKEILLPDGSRVLLNVNSRLSYPKKFTTDRREISFEGEGYFDIVSDSLHPFLIETEALKVKVLGTAFNLKSYKDDPTVETSLIKGKILVLSKDEKETLSVLAPNQKFIAAKQNLIKRGTASELKQDIIVEEIKYTDEDPTAPVDLAWKEGKMAFHSQPLSDIVRVMKRRYGVDIRIENENRATVGYSGTFEDETVEEVLDALKIVKDFKYRKEGDGIVIY